MKNLLHTTLGVVGSFTDLLKDPESLTNYLNQIHHPERLLEDLATKGKDIEQDIANFLKTPFCGCHEKPLYPKYVERADGQAFNQPYNIKGTKMFGFVVEGSMVKLQDICDKYLNNPNNGQIEYRPALPYLILTFNNIDSLSSIYPPDHDKGTLYEEETIFWMLTVVGKRIGPIFIAERLAWLMPYIYVNNSPILVSGREIYGIFKEIGTFNIPSSIDQTPELLSVDTLVFKEFTPETRSVNARLLEVKHIGLGDNHQSIKTWESFEEAITDIAKLVLGQDKTVVIPGLELPFELLDYLIEKIVPVVTLKQFRDVENSQRACYQALTESPMQLTTFYSGRILGWEKFGDQFALKINNFASQPIVQDLGLHKGYGADSDSAKIPVKLAFVLHFDFILKNGVTVWEASQR